MLFRRRSVNQDSQSVSPAAGRAPTDTRLVSRQNISATGEAKTERAPLWFAKAVRVFLKYAVLHNLLKASETGVDGFTWQAQ